jgi:hypothetical protein
MSIIRNECSVPLNLCSVTTVRVRMVNLNFGPESMTKMPFTCRMWQDAADQDATIRTQTVPKDGKYEVLFPVCLPDEGTFDWLDMFLETHPDYVELSDRMILDWAEKSGIYRPKGYAWKTSTDKPDMGFGIMQMDDLSIRRVLNTAICTQKRNIVYMEVKSNLLSQDRKEALRRFNAPQFKRVAQVMIGEPTKDFKEKVQGLLLKDKQAKSDAEFKAKKAEEARARLLEKRAKQAEREKRKAERAAKKAKTESDEAAKEGEDEKPADDAKVDDDEGEAEEDQMEEDVPVLAKQNANLRYRSTRRLMHPKEQK